MMLATPRPALRMAERRRLATASTGEVGCTVAIHSLSQETADSNDGVAARRDHADGDADHYQYRRCIQNPVSPPAEQEAEHDGACGYGSQAEQARPRETLRVVVAHPNDQCAAGECLPVSLTGDSFGVDGLHRHQLFR